MMKRLSLVAVAGLMSASTASALTFSAIEAQFDDADDLLRIAASISSVNSSFNELVFDWGNTLNTLDFSGASLLSSSVGGMLVPNFVGGLAAGVFAISDIPGAPFTAPFDFDILVSIPGAGGRFPDGKHRRIDL
ncbi:hypothetical protein [Jannaschia seohaensis]|uniref:Uncharacterized protein n=1 Tax=Jannaschia seohaensis TaxID=475081 RepID=A0A2Y9AG46_9RHOB|nr:hypothetical protein [Jannaschia seohaensis]PWJ20887.1 hypothetical protein BCF38_102133 [Jannaschia seohaensis]SSA41297.1 hypothetical protein SAMN05421539_102133 [Jannaschia seohaensis]